MRAIKKIHKKWSCEAKKAQEAAKKKYSLYNDETHCNSLIFLWGMTIDGDENANFYTWNAIDIVYNRDTGKYILTFDISDYKRDITIPLDSDTIDYLKDLQHRVNRYMDQRHSKFGIYPIISYVAGCDWDNMFISDSLEELQIKFNVFVNGLCHY